MRIVILGSGAMGSLYGGKLAEAGFDVVLTDIWKEHIDTVNTSGLSIEGLGGDSVIRSVKGVTRPEDAGKADLVIVFVKATATEEAMKGAMCILGPETVVLTLQNGLGNVEKLTAAAGGSRVIAGITGHGCTLLGPGRIKHAGQGETIIGEPGGVITERLRNIGAVLEKAGFAVKFSNNVLGLIWGKLFANIGINALTAITGLKNGRLLDFAETSRLMELAVKEAMEVAERKGIILEIDDPVEHARTIARLTAGNRSSMLQDVSAGRQTEIDVINGAIVQEGEKLGIQTPVNMVLTNLVRARQKSYGEVQ